MGGECIAVVLGPHLAADSGRWVKPQAGRGLGQEEEADSRGLLREGVCSGPENSLDFPEVREDKGQQVRGLQDGDRLRIQPASSSIM